MSNKKILIIVLIISIVGGLAFLVVSAQKAHSPIVQNNSGCQGLEVTNNCIALERAETDESRVKGLSDRGSLGPNTGMLFVFDKPAEQCMWMKDMRFSIDMIWLDANKKIVKIAPNLSPDTYPESFCAEKTKYVIELNTGEVQKNSLAAGQELKF